MTGNRGVVLTYFAILIAAAVAPPMTAASPTALWLHGDLPEDGWFAIRFNVTPDADLAVLGHLTPYLGSQERNGGATFIILDGVPKWQALGPHGVAHNWWTDMHWGHVATPAATVMIGSDGGDTGLYDSFFFGGNANGLRANSSVTFFGIYDASRGHFSANASWTKGVLSYDIATGRGIARQAEELNPGVHVGSYNWVTPRAAAGALLSDTIHTDGDFIGWFLPASNTSSIGARWTCRENGGACPGPGWGPDPFGLIPLIADEPTDWEVTIEASAEQYPAIVLAGAELPDDDYIRDD